MQSPGEPTALSVVPSLYLIPKQRKARSDDGKEGRQSKAGRMAGVGWGDHGIQDGKVWKLERDQQRKEEEEEMMTEGL